MFVRFQTLNGAKKTWRSLEEHSNSHIQNLTTATFLVGLAQAVVVILVVLVFHG